MVTAPTVDLPSAGETVAENTGGMIALIPAGAYLQQLAVPGGDDPGELHLTLVYLGDDVTGWPDDRRRAVVDAARPAASEVGDENGMIRTRAFGHAVFNPDGYADRDPVLVYLIGESDQLGLLRDRLSGFADAAQHEPFVPHVTAGQGISPSALAYTGPVLFDRIRVALGGDVTDIPLGGGSPVTAAVPPVSLTTPPLIVAASGSGANPGGSEQQGAVSVAELPPIDWFRDPQLTGPTALTVDDDGRVTGHLALWHTPHIGFPGRSVTPPRSRSDYAYFHTGSRIVAAGTQAATIPTGHITLDTGHADIGDDYRAASAHYDNTGTLVADVCAGEDQHGIWISGALSPGVDDLKLHRFRACGLSGDWRRIGPGLELVAALSVPTPGFPVPRSRVASGEPFALVAAGAVPPSEFTALDYDALADVIVDRIEHRRAVTAALTARRTALLAELDDSPARMAELLADFGEDDALTADISTMPPQLKESYLHGKAAVKIRWGTPGDFDRCVAEAVHHGIPGHMRKGMCSTLHRLATGKAPGKH